MVFCYYCGKEFSRKEHLERHVPNHTGIKPHPCGLCFMEFKRRDLLVKHMNLYHSPRNQTSPQPPVANEGRSRIACHNCATAKTACDRQDPCKRCVERNLKCHVRFNRRTANRNPRGAEKQRDSERETTSPSEHQPPSGPPSIASPDGSVLQHTLEASPPVPEIDGTVDPRLQNGAHYQPVPQYVVEKQPSPGFTSMLNEYSNNDMMMCPTNPMLNYSPWGDFTADDYTLYQSPPQTSGPYHHPNDAAMMAMPFPGNVDLSSGSEPLMTNGTSSRDTSLPLSGDYRSQTLNINMGTVRSTKTSVPEFEEIIHSDNAWPMARCLDIVYSGQCERTATLHLAALEEHSKKKHAWSELAPFLHQIYLTHQSQLGVAPQSKSISARTRDQLLVHTQNFLNKATEIHRQVASSSFNSNHSSPRNCNTIGLPPQQVLNQLVGIYLRGVVLYYSLEDQTVDPNRMVADNDASVLLLLLMIAQGASAVPITEARYLSTGLTETCRISLFDLIEKNVEVSANPTVLRCAFLFTLLGAWSGDAWLMKIAMGQRGMYFSMLKHAGMLSIQDSMIPSVDLEQDLNLSWLSWLQRESRNRLAYNFVMVDQELSLFHDCAPIFSITGIECPMPLSDDLWKASTLQEWLNVVRMRYGNTANMYAQSSFMDDFTPSLHCVFQGLLKDGLVGRRFTLSAHHLRLLLHPIQSLVFHLRQHLSCFIDLGGFSHNPYHGVSKASTLAYFSEVQHLLRQWYRLCTDFYQNNRDCQVTPCTLVMYHLIWLNCASNFLEIERLARRERFEGVDDNLELALRHQKCIFSREEVFYHSGQALRLLQGMPVALRPVWWAAALYRATLTLWVDALVRSQTSFRGADADAASQKPHLAIDRIKPDETNLEQNLWRGMAWPVLTRSDGSTFGMGEPAAVLQYGVGILRQAHTTRFADGIHRKLVKLGELWHMDDFPSPRSSN